MSPDAIADAALLEVSRWQRTPRKRTAQEVAASLWDERDEETGRLRDLEPHEQAFLTAVHQIGQDYTRVVGEANRHGVYLAVEFTARTMRDERYAAALAAYEAAKIAASEDALGPMNHVDKLPECSKVASTKPRGLKCTDPVQQHDPPATI